MKRIVSSFSILASEVEKFHSISLWNGNGMEFTPYAVTLFETKSNIQVSFLIRDEIE